MYPKMYYFKKAFLARIGIVTVEAFEKRKICWYRLIHQTCKPACHEICSSSVYLMPDAGGGFFFCREKAYGMPCQSNCLGYNKCAKFWTNPASGKEAEL